MSDSDKESAAPSTSGISNNNAKVARLAKHLRRRYWTSWEEIKLVEFWRRYSEEMTTTTKSDPAHASISQDMRTYGFYVNSQECRRKIQQFINKYNLERQIIEKSVNKAAISEWKLYPLVDCVLHPISSHKDICHEKKILKQLLDKLPPLPPSIANQRQSSNTVKLDVKSACRPNRTQSKPIVKIENGYTQQQPASVIHTQDAVKSENLPQPSASKDSPAAVNSVNIRKRTSCRAASIAAQPNKLPNGSLDFRLHRFKIPRLEELRADNKRLAERRDMALNSLYVQEREVQMLQTLVQSLQCRGK